MEDQIMVKVGDFVLPINPKSIRVTYKKKVIKHEIPGRDGEVIQVLGRNSKAIHFEGRFIGNKSELNKEGLFINQSTSLMTSTEQSLKLLYEFIKREPLELIFPIPLSEDSSIAATWVIIENVDITDEEGRNDYKDFSVDCVEWRPVAIKVNEVALVNQKAADDIELTLSKRNAIYNG